MRKNTNTHNSIGRNVKIIAILLFLFVGASTMKAQMSPKCNSFSWSMLDGTFIYIEPENTPPGGGSSQLIYLSSSGNISKNGFGAGYLDFNVSARGPIGTAYWTWSLFDDQFRGVASGTYYGASGAVQTAFTEIEPNSSYELQVNYYATSAYGSSGYATEYFTVGAYGACAD